LKQGFDGSFFPTVLQTLGMIEILVGVIAIARLKMGIVQLWVWLNVANPARVFGGFGLELNIPALTSHEAEKQEQQYGFIHRLIFID
jgi:hypothetical protein